MKKELLISALLILFPVILKSQEIEKLPDGGISLKFDKAIYLNLENKELSLDSFNDSLSTGKYHMTSKENQDKVVEFRLKRLVPFRSELIDLELPVLNFKDLKGREIEIGKGYPTIITLWSISCAPCIEEMILLNKIAHKFPDLKIYALTPNPPEEIEKFIDKYKYKWDHITILPDYNDEYRPYTKLYVYPSAILTDRSLVVKDFSTNSKEIYNVINSLEEISLDK